MTDLEQKYLNSLDKERERKRRYYHAHKEEMREKQKLYRRSKGIKPRSKRTKSEYIVAKPESSDYSIVRKEGETKHQARRRVWYEVLEDNDHLRCLLCGNNEHSSVIDYHHYDQSKYTTTPSRMFALNPTKDRVQVILDETVPLCSNCHRIHHYTNDHYTFEKKVVYYG